MEILKERILREGKNLGGGILKVDSFINHQVDPRLMVEVGQELARRFAHLEITKVLTAEISGIAPALTTALALGVPLVYARKTRPITMVNGAYRQLAPSHTKGRMVELMVSVEFLKPGDKVLIVDDFLATGQTIEALVRIVEMSGATLVGIGAVIEKTFEGGRERLRYLNVPIESLVKITDMADGRIVFGE
ncbi:MAG: xanthine phosphoribosyltransferase [Anaerolineae bacterium]|nr:xanthine phosphoribosyltransferase [Anaerolineae bacterium]MDW8101338.1 xanthine phosphoribosyltransferase [Anaerolineae bacterium]